MTQSGRLPVTGADLYFEIDGSGPTVVLAGADHPPTTVMVGELDMPCFHTMARIVAERIRGARLVETPDAGHMVNLEAPESVNRALREVISAPG